MKEGKINWPLVQVGERIINVEQIALIDPIPSIKYHYGVYFKCGTWYERLSEEELKELITVIKNYGRQTTA